MVLGIKSYGQQWILQYDVESTSVNVTLYDDSTEDPLFTQDDLSQLDANSNINDATISLNVSEDGSGEHTFSHDNVDVDVSNVTTTTYVDSYGLYYSGNVILTGGLESGEINIKDLDTVTINEVGGSFL